MCVVVSYEMVPFSYNYPKGLLSFIRLWSVRPNSHKEYLLSPV